MRLESDYDHTYRPTTAPTLLASRFYPWDRYSIVFTTLAPNERLSLAQDGASGRWNVYIGDKSTSIVAYEAIGSKETGSSTTTLHDSGT